MENVIMTHQRKISVTGLGYVGLTVAIAFGEKNKVIGFEKNLERIDELKRSYDRNNQITTEQFERAHIQYTNNSEDLKAADFHVIIVPTDIHKASKTPDFSILLEASKIVGAHLKKGDIVVYESTVYPGATEDACIPVLESASKLTCGKDFTVGYSPERINPADVEHTFQNIVKIVSATDSATLKIIADTYASVVKAGVYCVSNIRVAEATKLIENTQRDLNISILNEISIILHKLDINMSEVLTAAKTKWNFLNFYPGLVGGHCLNTNSYYLAHKALELGYSPDIIIAGRRTNDFMAKFVVEETIKQLKQISVPIKKAKIGILGLSYKSNYPGFSESKVIDIVDEFKQYDATIYIHDPLTDARLVKQKYNIDLEGWDRLVDLDAVILTVQHLHYVELYKEKFDNSQIKCKLIMDLISMLDPTQFIGSDITYWRL